MFWFKKEKTLGKNPDFTSYVVGKKFPLNRKKRGDGCVFEYLSIGPAVLFYYSAPTDAEINRIETAPFDVGFFNYECVLYVIANVGGDIAECPFNVNMYAESQTLRTLGETSELMSIFLIDADTNIIKAMRITRMPHQFAKALWDSISVQFEAAFDRDEYNALVDAIERRYSVGELSQYVQYAMRCD